jgi:pimeloyl-ACP methyl ester carboxylesterase
LCIESGYFGISRIDNDQKGNDYELPTFERNFALLLGLFKFRRLILLAGSVGAIHAIQYTRNHQNVDCLVLGSPALYRPRGYFIDQLNMLLLRVMLATAPEFFFDAVMVITAKVPRLRILPENMLAVEKEVGAKSYLKCLADIVQFGKRRQEVARILRDRALIFVGSRDTFFAKLCDGDICQQGRQFRRIDSGHGVLQEAGEYLFRAVRNQLAKG